MFINFAAARLRDRRLLVLLALWAFSPRAGLAQIGHVLDAVGPVNQSMGGAGTALPLDALGALHWNPASITGLSESEFGFGAAAFAPETELRSTVSADAFDPGFPPRTLGGATKSDTDVNPIPSFGFVARGRETPWSVGLGGFAIGGFGVDFPASPDNPILSAPPPGGLGVGPIYSDFQLMQFAPTAAYRTRSGWSFGAAPTVDWARLAVAPFSVASPDPNGRFTAGAHADSVWGLGFQVGTYFESPDSPWSLGASYKSRQRFQEFTINGVDSNQTPRQMTMRMDYPSMLSLGVAYRGFDRVRVAWDVRYLDYEGADGFQTARWDESGAATGFGWSSIWTTAVGVEYAVTDRLHWRVGYAANESPIDQSNIFFNAPAPAIVMHHLSTGFTQELGDRWFFSTAFKYGFENSVSGAWRPPGVDNRPVPGTEVEASLATYALSFGFSKRF